MNLFYTPDIDKELYALDETESRHCTRVLRLKEGDHIHLTDGKGTLYEAEIIVVHQKKSVVKVVSKEFEEAANFRIHIAVAPTKNMDRLEWFLEKATEIGIDEVSPILCEHSERRNLRIDRLEKVMVSAMKQSLKTYLPVIHEMIDFKKFIIKDYEDQKFIAHLEKENPVQLKDAYVKNKNVLILIGPEGDFSENEISLATSAGFKIISLGNSRLRTETAALVACHSINILNQ